MSLPPCLFLTIRRFIGSIPIIPLPPLFKVSDEVSNALKARKGVVALESTVITHGMPHPTNLQTALSLETIVRKEGAIPATIALLDGQIRVGLCHDELERISLSENKPIKVSRRDLANCLSEKKIGGTTVAATMWVAHKVGIRIFATGGIGGVHREGENTMDISADLTELGRTPVAVVCAGVKSILDIGRTLEYLETQSVNVTVFDRTPNFPGFFIPRTPFKAPYHTDSLERIADILFLSDRLALPNGTLIACPVPDKCQQMEVSLVEKATETALEEAKKCGLRGAELTPFVLAKVSQLSESASMATNIALLENNARIAAQLAVLYSTKMSDERSDPSPLSCPSFVNRVQTHRKAESAGFRKELTIERRPKIVCAGASIVDVQVLVNGGACPPPAEVPSVTGGAYLPSRIVATAGGVARNHADALSRLGCDATLLSALGCDEGNNGGKDLDLFGRFLMEKGAHINWSHVLRCPNFTTASSVGIGSGGSSTICQGFIAVDPIMAQMGTDYVSNSVMIVALCDQINSKSHLIAGADFVLVDGNLDVRSLRQIVHLAEEAGTKVWYEPTNWLKVPKLFASLGPNALHKCAAISPNLNELDVLSRHLHDAASEQFVRELRAQLCSAVRPTSVDEWICGTHIPPMALFPPNMSFLLITCDSRGVVLLSRCPASSDSLSAQFVPPPNVQSDQIVCVSGAGDCFNSGFLSSQLHGLDLMESVSVATKCAKLSLCSAQVVPEGIQWPLLNGCDL